jgi:hypothetical protein
MVLQQLSQCVLMRVTGWERKQETVHHTKESLDGHVVLLFLVQYNVTINYDRAFMVAARRGQTGRPGLMVNGESPVVNG